MITFFPIHAILREESIRAEKGKARFVREIASKIACVNGPLYYLSCGAFFYSRFKRLCERAFLILRRHGPLFINLLAMMLSAGIPELRSLDDISHLQKTLVLSLPEDEALDHFRRKLDETFKNSWKTSTDWFLRKFKR